MLHVGGANMVSETGELIELKTAEDDGLKSGKFAFDETMVLYSKIRPYLMKVARPDFAGLCSADVYPLSPRASQLSRDFLFYILLSKDFTDFAIAGSARAGMPKVNRDHLFSFQFLLPPVQEQRRIVSILDVALAGIATAKANAEKNLQNARAVVRTYLEFLFDEAHQGWEKNEKPLSDLCELIVDCEHKTAPTEAEGHPLIRTPNIGKGELMLDGVYRVSESTFCKWTRRAEPRPGDLIFAREAPAGNVGVIPSNEKVCLGQRTVLIRPFARLLNPHFLALALLQPGMQRRLLDKSRGATVEHVNMKDIRELHLDRILSIPEQ
jgi:type I restriction enzyme, S subunit